MEEIIFIDEETLTKEELENIDIEEEEENVTPEE